jgi:hypothetical protein
MDASPLTSLEGEVIDIHLRITGYEMMKRSTFGLDLAKRVFVRPASRLSFCFTGGVMT